MLTFPYNPDSGSGVGTVTEAGTSRTLAATDLNKLIKCTANTDITITVNEDIFAVGNEVYFEQAGTGQILFNGTATVKTSTDFQKKSGSQNAIIGLRFESATVANLFGDRELV